MLHPAIEECRYAFRSGAFAASGVGDISIRLTTRGAVVAVLYARIVRALGGNYHCIVQCTRQ